MYHRKSAPALAVIALTFILSTAQAATFGELTASPMTANGMPAGQGVGPYAAPPGLPCPPNCYLAQPAISGGPEGMPPSNPNVANPAFIPFIAAHPRARLPYGDYADLPHAQVQLWSFGQVNSGTDPYNPWGFSTPHMFVPWSTPLSGWTNANTWNWWRERSGALPRNW